MAKYDPAKEPLKPAADGRPAFIRNVDDLPSESYERPGIAGSSKDIGEATGAKLLQVPKKVLEATYLNYQPQTRRPYGLMEWPALLRMLDRVDPGYRN